MKKVMKRFTSVGPRVKTFEELVHLEKHHGRWINDIFIIPDHELVVSGDTFRNVKVYHIPSRKIVFTKVFTHSIILFFYNQIMSTLVVVEEKSANRIKISYLKIHKDEQTGEFSFNAFRSVSLVESRGAQHVDIHPESMYYFSLACDKHVGFVEIDPINPGRSDKDKADVNWVHKIDVGFEIAAITRSFSQPNLLLFSLAGDAWVDDYDNFPKHVPILDQMKKLYLCDLSKPFKNESDELLDSNVQEIKIFNKLNIQKHFSFVISVEFMKTGGEERLLLYLFDGDISDVFILSMQNKSFNDIVKLDFTGMYLIMVRGSVVLGSSEKLFSYYDFTSSQAYPLLELLDDKLSRQIKYDFQTGYVVVATVGVDVQDLTIFKLDFVWEEDEDADERKEYFKEHYFGEFSIKVKKNQCLQIFVNKLLLFL